MLYRLDRTNETLITRSPFSCQRSMLMCKVCRQRMRPCLPYLILLLSVRRRVEDVSVTAYQRENKPGGPCSQASCSLVCKRAKHQSWSACRVPHILGLALNNGCNRQATLVPEVNLSRSNSSQYLNIARTPRVHTYLPALHLVEDFNRYSNHDTVALTSRHVQLYSFAWGAVCVAGLTIVARIRRGNQGPRRRWLG
jgi:hypothetical protein